MQTVINTVSFAHLMSVRRDTGSFEIVAVSSQGVILEAGLLEARLAAFRKIVGREPASQTELLSRTPIFHPVIVEVDSDSGALLDGALSPPFYNSLPK